MDMITAARWPFRRVLKVWGIGLVIEALLFGAMFTLLVHPDPDLVDKLQGEYPRSGTVTIFRSDVTPSDSARLFVPPPDLGPRPDSFFTVLHWPLNKPLLEGGGRVIAMPVSRWWIPALYVGLVPMILITLTAAWLISRGMARRQPSADANPDFAA
jgi:hypothetical protein